MTPALGALEVLLRSYVAHTLGMTYGPVGHYWDPSFYSPGQESPIQACARDVSRSKERFILRYRRLAEPDLISAYQDLPIWSAVEAWSFGTLSKVLERGALGLLHEDVALCLGIAKGGFPYRIRALVYLRNRCAHHARLWNHSVIDAGPTPNNVRAKAKRQYGQFDPRSVVDVLASLDDILQRSGLGFQVLPELASLDSPGSPYWQGLARPTSPQDAGV